MKKGFGKWFIIAPVLFVAFALLMGWIVMQLWNVFLVPATGLALIGFWQALGLLVLSRILFGNFGYRGKPWQGRHPMQEKWASMTPDERERFRETWRSRCGTKRWQNEVPKSDSAVSE